jgi:hypothetical protein
MTTRALAELFGILGGLTGTVGGLLLAFPLFYLLRARKAMEDLEIAFGNPIIDNDTRTKIEVALQTLRTHLRTKRARATNIGAAGVVFLIFSFLFLSFQFKLFFE